MGEPKVRPRRERAKGQPKPQLTVVPRNFEEAPRSGPDLGDQKPGAGPVSLEAMIERCAGIHMRPQEIALVLDISEAEVKAHGAALERGLAKAKYKVANTAFLIATDPTHPKCATLNIFWNKCHNGWNDVAAAPFGQAAADADSRHLTDEIVEIRFEETMKGLRGGKG